MEGARVRKIYAECSLKYNVKWEGRNYNQESWNYGDPINRALSAANACLYGVVHAAILAAGFSTAVSLCTQENNFLLSMILLIYTKQKLLFQLHLKKHKQEAKTLKEGFGFDVEICLGKPK